MLSLLGWRKVVIEDNRVGPVALQQSFQPLHLALADQIGRVIAGPLLLQACGHPGSGCGSQGSQFIQRLLQAQAGSPGGSRTERPLQLTSNQDGVFSDRWGVFHLSSRFPAWKPCLPGKEDP